MDNYFAIDEAFQKMVFLVMQELKKEGMTTPADKYVSFRFQHLQEDVPAKDQERVLRFLEQKNVIKIKNKSFPLPFISELTATTLNVSPSGALLDINNPQFEELLNNLSQKIPANNFKIDFDLEKGLLKFMGKDIELSKKGKETSATMLMNSLMSTIDGDWKYNDQILKEWGYNTDDLIELPKNKVYFAGVKINNAVEIKTGVTDFIELNTAKARINPKYYKVDE